MRGYCTQTGMFGIQSQANANEAVSAESLPLHEVYQGPCIKRHQEADLPITNNTITEGRTE